MMNIDRLNELLSERYTVERESGRGGMATVYLAHDRELNRDVALKVLLPELTVSIQAQRFLREIEIAARLNHPNILSLHEVGRTGSGADGQSDGLLYYAMPYVDGETLRERLDREKQISIDEALRIAAEVADALSHAHTQGVVHRDIKPENILLEGERVLVSDFGIARALSDAGGERLTRSGFTLGTASYMSPEQAAADPKLDARSDVYSLGCVLYEMIGGEPPFTGPSDQAVLARHARDEPSSLSTIRSATPREVEALVNKCLAKKPKGRFKSAAHLGAALRQPRTASQARDATPTNSSLRRVAVASIVVAGVVLGAWRSWAYFKPPPDARTGVVAVLPFQVDGEFERPLDGESITTLLSTFFGYMERYSVIRPDEVRRSVEDVCPSVTVERQCGSRVAIALGAQYQVTGTVTPVQGDSVMIVAYLSDELERRSIPPVSVRGSKDSAYTLLNELYRELAGASAAKGEEVVANAAMSTESMAAFAALLDGEVHLSRYEWDSAGRYYQRATEADSTYALAWYRLGVVHDWKSHPGPARWALAHAERYSDQLAPRQRRLLQGYRAHIEGEVTTAERIYRELLREDPEDFEVLMQLGYLYFFYGWRLGVSMNEAVELLRKAVGVSPHRLAANYLTWALMAVPIGDSAMLTEADSLSRRYGYGLSLVIEAVRAGHNGDSSEFAKKLDSIGAGFAKNPLWTHTLFGFVRAGMSARGDPNFAAFIRAMERASKAVDPEPISDTDRVREIEVLIRSNIAIYEAARGRWRAATTAAQTLDQMGSVWALFEMATLLTLPIPSPVPMDADSLRRRLEDWRPAEHPPPNTDSLRRSPDDWVPAGEPQRLDTISLGIRPYYPVIRQYLVGLLYALEGDHNAANASAARLEAMDPPEGAPTLHIDLALGVRAEVLMQQNRPAEALAALEAAPRRIHYTIDGLVPGDREVFLRARALQALGRYEEALAWYTPHPEKIGGPVLLAPAHLYRGQIYEDMGDIEKALWHYGAFTELWRDADPEYQPLVEDVRGRMGRLTAEQ